MYPLANWLLASLFLTGGFRGLIEGETQPEPLRVRPDFVKTGSNISVKRTDDLGGYKSSNKQFTVQCAIEWKRDDEKSAIKNENPIKTLRFPQLTLHDGERGQISDRSSDSYIVAELPDPSLPRGSMPVTRELRDGTTVEVTVLGINEREALLDVMIEFQGTRQSGDEKSHGLRVDYVKGRAIECVEIGELATLKLRTCFEIALIGKNSYGSSFGTSLRKEPQHEKGLQVCQRRDESTMASHSTTSASTIETGPPTH